MSHLGHPGRALMAGRSRMGPTLSPAPFLPV